MSENSSPSDLISKQILQTQSSSYTYYSIKSVQDAGLMDINKTPYSIRVLLENVIRNADIGPATEDHIKLISSWRPDNKPNSEFPYMPGRVLLQDFTGVPVAVDIAAMRDAVRELGADASMINPIVRSDMVIDHSVQVDHFSTPDALNLNIEMEFDRNTERYQLLKWAQNAFDNFKIVPRGTGIVNHVNL